MLDIITSFIKGLFSSSLQTKQLNNDPRAIKLSTSSATRRLVIPDIHGCPKTLQGLLNQIDLKKTDYLFFLGDYIDKGVDSKGVLDSIISLINNGYSIYPLRGNHEDELIETIEIKDKILSYHAGNNLEPLLKDEYRLLNEYEDFLFQLPYYYELEDYFLVHAGFNFKAKEPFKDFDEMLWVRSFPNSLALLKEKKLIHGHTPTPIEDIFKMIKEEQRICLDAGAVFNNIEGLGELLCLDLDSLKVYRQRNLDKKPS
ncbi:metallophosphoesterase family protein [Flammeovirga kamogawensis]|uniref:Serine/threonine protein phosphatase n=1 Tax=Flammeovirga kamogawensis TaxID=373891 RepID=A0ABX8GZM8_9BACT|nr:metallophosphoesterase family protein [Flammeovirga kamogawensis]MBB6459308.1 serine/threonine protein phosphatase 1 [Flammeovirga kamogawensis]QWG08868.1 serine/threonine protein phosphatase [Flammeovirga kamogawensis]TRX67158.1 serine/threonine protein phosphatase [Flammeovirga kamogawensis]